MTKPTGNQLAGGARSSAKLTHLVRDIREAVHGTEQDFTQGPLGRAILLLSIPMVLEMVMESVFAVVDVFFVSKLGSSAVAAVGITESMLTLVYAVAIGLSMGTTALVARRIGEKQPREAATASIQAIGVGIAASVPVAIVGVVFGPRLLAAMGADFEVIRIGGSYTTIMIGGNVVIMLLFIINAVFRGAGDAAIAMRVLWLANAINIVLDPCLILGIGPFPELGVAGAAVATNIGRGTGVAFQLWVLCRGNGRVQPNRDQVRLNWTVMKRLVRVSIGGIGQFIIATSSWIGMVRIVAMFGSEILAGYTIAVRIIMFSILPSWGLSNAAATLVGQNLGAAQPQRAERSVWLTGFWNMIFLGIVAALFISFSESLLRIFTEEQAVVSGGARCLRLISYGYLFYAYGMVLVQAFNGAGDTTTPTIINFFCFWLLEIPLAYLLALPAGIGENGVYIAIIVAESLVGIVGAIVFRRGHWKSRQV